MAEARFNGLLKTIATTLKEERDPETKQVTGYHTETKVALAAIELDDETLRMLAALQSDGELVITVSRRQGVLFKGSAKGAEAH
jgi:hypothetical protein